MQMAQFSILTSRKIMAEITNHQQSPTTLQSHAVLVNCLGVPPLCPTHFFTYTYTPLPTLWAKTLRTPLLPFLHVQKRATIPSDHVSFL